MVVPPHWPFLVYSRSSSCRTDPATSLFRLGKMTSSTLLRLSDTCCPKGGMFPLSLEERLSLPSAPVYADLDNAAVRLLRKKKQAASLFFHNNKVSSSLLVKGMPRHKYLQNCCPHCCRAQSRHVESHQKHPTTRVLLFRPIHTLAYVSLHQNISRTQFWH